MRSELYKKCEKKQQFCLYKKLQETKNWRVKCKKTIFLALNKRDKLLKFSLNENILIRKFLDVRNGNTSYLQ